MREILSKLLSLLSRRERLKAAVLLGLMVINAFFQTLGVASVMPFLSVLADPGVIETNQWLKAIYEGLDFQDTRSFLFLLGGAAFTLIIVGNAVQAITQWVTVRFAHMRQYSLSRRLMADYLRRPYSFFVARNSGDLAKTVLEETQQAVIGALMPVLRLISNGLLTGFIVALLIVVDPVIAIIGAGAVAGAYGLIYIAARRWLQRIGVARVKANQQRFTTVGEAFAGAKEIRLLGRERAYLSRYENSARVFARNQANASLLSSIPGYAIEAIAFGGVVLLVLYLMADGAGLAHLLPLIGLYAMAGKRLIPAFQKLFAAFTSLRFSMPAVDNLIEDLGDREGSTPLPDARQLPEPMVPERDIQFDKLRYRYPGSDQPALQDLSLTIQANTTVGLVGSSGAGKSTLVDILLGLLQPESGSVRVDGNPLGPDNIRRWQAGIGYVPQHIFLADDSVAGNIALGVPPRHRDRDAVVRAARLANLHDFVTEELPNAYDTPIGERGVRLSGGQRQRIGIARALYRDPPVLVFDEATSALDNATERAVMEAVHNLASQKTIILIAHRLTTVKPSNQIYVLDAGRVVEQGTWDQLVQGGSHFQNLAALGEV